MVKATSSPGSAARRPPQLLSEDRIRIGTRSQKRVYELVLFRMSLSTSDVKEGRINDQLGSQLESLSAQVEANVERGRDAVAEWRAILSDKASQFAGTMNRYTHQHPWRMISSGLIAGMLVGLLFGCQSSRKARF